MYQTLTLLNLPDACKILVRCVSTGTAPGGVTKVRIKRRKVGSQVWHTISEISIAKTSDFTFEYYDAGTRSRQTYNYMVIPVSGTTEGVGVSGTIECDFDGIYVSDATGEWICVLNPKYDYVLNFGVAYQKLLTGAYPKRIRNWNARYATGSVTGLFLPKDDNDQYMDVPQIVKKAREYKTAFLDALCNQHKKTIRTYDGHMWIVGVDDNPKEEFSEYDGASEITFNWTELEKAPFSD